MIGCYERSTLRRCFFIFLLGRRFGPTGFIHGIEDLHAFMAGVERAIGILSRMVADLATIGLSAARAGVEDMFGVFELLPNVEDGFMDEAIGMVDGKEVLIITIAEEGKGSSDGGAATDASLAMTKNHVNFIDMLLEEMNDLERVIFSKKPRISFFLLVRVIIVGNDVPKLLTQDALVRRRNGDLGLIRLGVGY